jgi:preprotein translocase subunit SecG
MVDVIKIIVTVLQVIFSIGLVAVVLLQSGKESGLSGTISGGADTYMGKGKSNTLDQKLASWTKWVALVWVALTVTLSVLSLI